MIPSEGWDYLAVAKLLALLRKIKSKNSGDFYYYNCLHSFRRKNKLNHVKKYVETNILAIL